MFRLNKIIMMAVWCAAVPTISFGKDKEAWEKFTPPEDNRFDWVQMNSGEWLKGEIKVMYSFSLEFDSDELGLLDLDMDDVKIIRSSGYQEVLVETGRRETTVADGKLLIEGEKVTVIDGENVQEFKRVQLVSIAGGHKRERDNWSGSFSLGMTARGGNTETLDVNVSANLKRRTAMTRLNIDYLSNYSEAQTTDATTGVKTRNDTAENQRLSGYFDWFLASRFYWQIINAEYYHDPFVNIGNQYSASTGVGYDLVRSSRTEWTVSAGAGYQETQFDVVAAGDPDSSDSPYGTIGTRLDVELSGDLDYLYDYSARFLSEENGSYTHHMVSTLSYEIIADLDLDISVIWDRIESPAASEDDLGNPYTPEKDDYQVVVGVGYSF